MLNGKKIVYTAGVCFTIFFLTGCGNKIPDMTEEENALITEYAAGILLEHHADYQGRLVDTSLTPEEKSVSLQEAEDADELQTKENTSAEAEQVSNNSAEAVQEKQNSAPSIAQVLDLPGFTVSYMGYEICDSYPDEQTASEELYFAVHAESGKKLVVLKLQITNGMSEPQVINTLELAELKCRVILDGARKSSLVTMLDNDFMALEKTMDAGATMEAVVMTEITEAESEQIQMVQLQIQNGDRSTMVQ